MFSSSVPEKMNTSCSTRPKRLLVHVVEAHEQVDEGGLARPGVSHHRHAAALGDDAGEIPHHLAALRLVGEGHPFQADLPVEGQRQGTLGLGNLVLVVQELEDPLAGGQGGLHDVVAFRQFPDGPEEAPGLLDEGQEEPQGQGAGLELVARIQDERGEGAVGDEFHHGEEHRVGEDRAQEGVQVGRVQVPELRSAPGLLGVELHQGHAGELLLEEGLDGGVAALGLAVGLGGVAAEDLRGDQEQRHDAHGHQGEPHVLGEHPHHDGRQGQGVPHDRHEAGREHLVEVLHVADHPGHEPAHGVVMEEPGAALHEVGEDLQAQVQHGHLAHPAQEPVAEDLHHEPQHHEAQEGQDQGAGAPHGPLGQMVVDEAQGEFRRQDLQHGPHDHEDQQGHESGPIRLEVPHEADQEGVPPGLLVDLVGVEKTTRRISHETILS
jgi:hypothetical protein